MSPPAEAPQPPVRVAMPMPPSAPGSTTLAVTVVEAGPAQVGAALALLPELLQAQTLPTRWAVAHLVGQPSQLVGAAACVPVMHLARWAGFRGQCRVLPGCRRQGVGRALLAWLAADVAAWDVPHLLSWQAVDADGPAGRFLQALGGRVNFSLHHFIAAAATTLPLCERLSQALQAHGRVPPGFQLLPLAQAPLAPLLDLHCREFSADRSLAQAAFAQALADPLIDQLSVALWDGRTLAGYLLAGRGADMPEVRFWASQPDLRAGWPAVLLLAGFVRRAVARGILHARYHCNGQALAALNVARKTGAQATGVQHGYVLDLLAAPAPAA